MEVGKKELKNNVRNGSDREVGLEIKMAQYVVFGDSK